MLLDGFQDWSWCSVQNPESNNRGDNNVYWYEVPEAKYVARFEWENSELLKRLHQQDFDARPGEEGGRYAATSGEGPAPRVGRSSGVS